MARRRFFVSEVRKGGAVIEGEDARHLTRVLRVEAGQRYEISDGDRAYLAEIAAARKEFVEFRIIEDLPPAPRMVTVSLLASLIKFDHFELLIEKATELGVSEIIPVIASRTEAGLEKAVPKRMERWQRIALE
ncbi:MAG TPA: RsmE family RNA methyltransferase, partial [Bryobacteraceae bacterium]